MLTKRQHVSSEHPSPACINPEHADRAEQVIRRSPNAGWRWVAWANLFARGLPTAAMGKLSLAHGSQQITRNRAPNRDTGVTQKAWFVTGKLLPGILLLATLFGCAPLRSYQAKRSIERGETLLASQHLEAALIEFQEAAALAPQWAVAHSRMGLIYRRMGEYGKAIDAFLEAVHRNPASFEDVIELAQLYHFTKRIKDAIQAYLRAVELNDRDFDAQLNLGTCYQQTRDYAQAVERFAKAIAIDPLRPQAYVNLGVALDAQKKYYGAIRAYKDALERDSRQPLVLVNLANTYMKQDRLKLAQHTLEQAIAVDKALAPAHEALGYCLFRRRNFDAAQQSYSMALRYDQDLPHAHSGLGSIFMLRFLKDPSKTDLRARAIEHWHRSLEIKPDQPRVRNLISKYKPKPNDDPETSLLDRRRQS